MSLLELLLQSGESSLSVRRFFVREAMAEPFEITIEARSPNDDLAIGDIVGFGAIFRLRSGIQHAAGDRSWSGICNEMELMHVEPAGLSTYRLTIVPRIWLLGKRRNHRVFQHLNAPEIASRILAEWQIPSQLRVDGTVHPRFPLKVQYGESDLVFLQRLLEDAGIALRFGQSDEGQTHVVLDDRPHTAAPRVGGPLLYVDNPNESAEREYVTDLRLVQRVVSLRHTLRDVDFRRSPAFPLFVHAAVPAAVEGALEQFEYVPGAFAIETSRQDDTPIADDRGAVRHDERAGQTLVHLRLEEAQSARRCLSFSTNAMDLQPGVAFEIAGHPRSDLSSDRKLLVTNLSLEGAVGEAWTITGSAVFTDVPYRPARVTPKPDVHGIESAVVVGPPGEEIHTDEFGRVRIQFAWDREGKFDDASSCWVRVSQAWAGTGYGFMAIPRVGQEVLVGFVAGDPDQPVIVGRLHDGVMPVPYKLPANKSVTGLRTASTPHSEGYNELRFDDMRGQELVHIHAERNLSKVVKVDEKEVTGKTRVIEVGEKLVLTNGQVSIVLDGPNLTIEGKGKICVSSQEDDIVMKGAPHVYINPAPPRKKKARSIADKPRRKSKAGVHIERYSEGVELFGSAIFREVMRKMLDTLWTTRTGRSLLRKVARTGRTIRIVETLASGAACRAVSLNDALRTHDGRAGVGSSSMVLFNPNYAPEGATAEVVLCKQLVHAYHNAAGLRERGLVNGVRAADLRAIGLAPYPRRAPTENSLRKERGLPERTEV